MTDKAIVICALLTALAVTAIVFVRRAMRYRKALGAVVPENEVIPEADTTPEVQPEPEPPLEELSARQAYVDKFIFPVRRSSKGNKTVSISAEHHARITAILNIVNRYGISLTRYLDGVLKAHFEDNAEIIGELFGDLSDEPHIAVF